MQSCSKLFNSKFSNPNISRMAMEDCCLSLHMMLLTFSTNQVKSLEYRALDKASLHREEEGDIQVPNLSLDACIHALYPGPVQQ